MTTQQARDKAKSRLDIDLSDTTFDSLIDGFVTDAVDRIPPDAYREVPVQSKIIAVDSYGRTSVDLSTLTTPLDDVRKVEVSIEGVMSPVAFRVHDVILFIDELPSFVTSVDIYGLVAYTIGNLPARFNLGVVWYTMAEFYSFLVGSSRYYNEYMQNGRGRVDNMADLADYYENKAKELIQEKGQLYAG